MWAFGRGMAGQVESSHELRRFTLFLISMGMVMGAFVVRWTVPTMPKGTGLVFSDLRQKPHSPAWALLAGDAAVWCVTSGAKTRGNLSSSYGTVSHPTKNRVMKRLVHNRGMERRDGW